MILLSASSSSRLRFKFGCLFNRSTVLNIGIYECRSATQSPSLVQPTTILHGRICMLGVFASCACSNASKLWLLVMYIHPSLTTAIVPKSTCLRRANIRIHARWMELWSQIRSCTCGHYKRDIHSWCYHWLFNKHTLQDSVAFVDSLNILILCHTTLWPC